MPRHKKDVLLTRGRRRSRNRLTGAKGGSGVHIVAQFRLGKYHLLMRRWDTGATITAMIGPAASKHPQLSSGGLVEIVVEMGQLGPKLDTFVITVDMSPPRPPQIRVHPSDKGTPRAAARCRLTGLLGWKD